MQSLRDLVRKLVASDDVSALVEYGSRHHLDEDALGDYDLFVIFDRDKPLEIESLHFRLNGTPIDLNLRTLKQIQHWSRAEGFDVAILQGTVIHDPSGATSAELDRLRSATPTTIPASEHAIAFTRHGHRHVFDKIRGRYDENPTLAELLLAANIHWLLQAHFRVRGMAFHGEKRALAELKKLDPTALGLIESFFAARSFEERLQVSERLTTRVLEPVGGAWQDSELLAFADEETVDLERKGAELYVALFGKPLS